MTINNGDILRVAARLEGPNSEDIVNVYHFKVNVSAPYFDSLIVVEVGDYLEDVYGKLLSWIGDTVHFVDINIFNVTQGIPVAVAPWPNLTVGAEASKDIMPAQTAALVRFPTGFSRNWARKFIGGLSEESNGPTGNLVGGLMTALGLYGAALLTPWAFGVADTLEMVVWHKGSLAYVPVLSVVVKNIWATIRTRRVGRGS